MPPSVATATQSPPRACAYAFALTRRRAGGALPGGQAGAAASPNTRCAQVRRRAPKWVISQRSPRRCSRDKAPARGFAASAVRDAQRHKRKGARLRRGGAQRQRAQLRLGRLATVAAQRHQRRRLPARHVQPHAGRRAGRQHATAAAQRCRRPAAAGRARFGAWRGAAGGRGRHKDARGRQAVVQRQQREPERVGPAGEQRAAERDRGQAQPRRAAGGLQQHALRAQRACARAPPSARPALRGALRCAPAPLGRLSTGRPQTAADARRRAWPARPAERAAWAARDTWRGALSLALAALL